MCNILHFRITFYHRTPIITPKCVIYYTFVLHFHPQAAISAICLAFVYVLLPDKLCHHVPEVPEVPEVMYLKFPMYPMFLEYPKIVWQNTYYTCHTILWLGPSLKILNKTLTIIFVYVI